jgi:hypothetical protein
MEKNGRCYGRQGIKRKVILLLGSLLLALPAACQQQPIARLAQATGEVSVRRGQEWLRVASLPLDLFSGDKVATGQGRAEIHFASDDSTLVLDVGGNLTITEAQESATAKLVRRAEVFLGDMWFSMKGGPNKQTDLVTPTAVGGLRGTEGLVHVDSGTQSEFSLTEGELEIVPRTESGRGPGQSQPFRLRAGQVLHAQYGQALHAEAARVLPHRPALNVPAAQLPKPRPDWRQSIPQGEREPPSSLLPALSTRRQANAQREAPSKRPTGEEHREKAGGKKNRIEHHRFVGTLKR